MQVFPYRPIIYVVHLKNMAYRVSANMKIYITVNFIRLNYVPLWFIQFGFYHLDQPRSKATSICSTLQAVVSNMFHHDCKENVLNSRSSSILNVYI